MLRRRKNMKNKTIKKALAIGMSVLMLASTVVPISAQAASWKQNKTGWWWEEDHGSYPTNSWKNIGGTWYYFDGNGYMATGWLKLSSGWYYLTGSGAMATGWVQVGNTWYYMNESGVMQADTWIGDNYVDGSGAWIPGKAKTQTGWVKSGNRWWYSHSDGSYTTNDWEVINGRLYYFDGSGWMVTGWLKRPNGWYYLTGSGAMATGWVQVGSTWYYMNESGVMQADTWIGDNYVDGSGAWIPGKVKTQAGWVKSGNRWWYRHADGGYTTNGWEMINGTWYYFDGSGWMVTGWKQVNGSWYYMDASGAMVKNAWVGDYYLGADGAMATNTWIGQYYVDGSGKWVPNKQKEPAKQEPTKQETALQSISLNQTSLQMWVGGSETLEVNCTPSNTTVDKTVTWKSSNEKVATVKDGKVETVGEGEAVITAEVAGKKASCIVKTEQYYHLTYHGNTDFLPVGGYGFLWIGGPDDLIAPYFEIYSLNEDIATIDENGNLTGISEGTATIVVEGREKKGFITVEVKKHAEFQVAYFEQDTYSMKTGDKLQLEVNIVPDNTLIDKLPLWKSSDPTVAEVDGNGVVRAMGIGETRITCILTEHPLTSFGPEGTILIM
ncbi:hypothetical protein DWY34_07805 [Blautia sp. AF25-12LB]|nr:hypothetical protein DWY34_07805 [Blautia sp. AF25-12LB]